MRRELFYEGKKKRQKKIRGKIPCDKKEGKDEGLRTVHFMEVLAVFLAIQVLELWHSHILKIQ